ncbi:hypothetical protein [Herbaspirillum huttiense]|uniref:hypothetical protein n=1 Tax=Herbaspirillum huttiense TaxID=863372 RepID=UPI003F3078C6
MRTLELEDDDVNLLHAVMMIRVEDCQQRMEEARRQNWTEIAERWEGREAFARKIISKLNKQGAYAA